MSYEEKTQKFSTFGDKLMQHTDVLCEIQNNKCFRPINIQLSPTEACDSHCPFCSVANRPMGRIPFDKIAAGLTVFRKLGAKAVEITGGGNPLLYRDGSKNINDVIELAYSLEYDIGVITNSENLQRHLRSDLCSKIKWIRVSLAKLDEGKTPEDYLFEGFDINKLALSYIIHKGTTAETIENIARVVERYPQIKFVRIAPDCLTEASLTISEEWGEIIKSLDKYDSFFIKEINDNYLPHNGGCWVGLIRPYWTSTGIYICTSHVLSTQNYCDTWKLCEADQIEETWAKMNDRFKNGLAPYDIDISKCWHCYYCNNNKILQSVIKELPDRNFA